MGLWILEPQTTETVPGTTRYFDDPERPQQVDANNTQGLKCDTSGPVAILLVPQPSDDPNDPLNWPLWQRDLILALLSLVAIFATSLGSILAANTLTLSLYFKMTFTKVAILTGWYLFGTGVGAIVFVPSARIWGKRHQFVLGPVLIFISCIWAGAVRHNYDSLAAARFFQGVGTAPFETLVNAAVGDLYFVHQRGKRMAMTNLAVFGGAFFTPIVVGKITHVKSLQWPWTFYFVAIFIGICVPLIYFFVPETAYNRAAHLNTDLATNIELRSKDSEDGTKNSKYSELPEETGTANYTASGAETPRRSRVERLRLVNGRISQESFWKLLLRPFPIFFQPAVLWACVIQGSMIGWTVFMGIILGAIFLGPPLFWNEEQTGYAYTGAFLGAIIGFFIAGVLSDWSAKYLTKKNNGIYEPEFRLVLVIPSMICGCVGIYLFGITASELINYSVYLPILGFGLQVAGMVIGAVAASLYLVDAHRDIIVETLTTTIIFKNLFSFGLTFSAYDWLVQAGTYKTFMWISSIQVIVCLTTIPLYFYGKRNREYFHRNDIMEICRLTDQQKVR
ncbi:hypothetical protein HYFRA_00006970 [Hymenoscyphus fraxineus]|uniref:Major facilitator superfamily (MFS) profile domain-containing protein n=1 Tax=Hymenoscyphus fraxineus TaxID=746836 RepID=A0A9N9KMH4_9HELO|nr:hypothetical protein HYFRA_00006970 [Hymenoscyphus fraxineus]